MQESLLDRLQVALDKVLEQNRCLAEECHQLTQEESAWQQEKAALLVEVERTLRRFDDLDLEDL